MPSVDEIIFLSGSGSNVIASGPIASAPDAGTWWNKAPGKIGGLYYNTVATADTPVGPCVAVRSFHNEGVDYGDWGRLAAIVDSIRPCVDSFSVCFIGTLNNPTTAKYFIGIGNSATASERQFGFRHNSNTSDSLLAVSIGGAYIATSIVLPQNTMVNICASFSASGNMSVFIGGVLSFTGSFSGNTYVDTSRKILLGALDSASPSSNNSEGDTTAVKFHSGYASDATSLSRLPIIAQFNANSPAQWDGGASAVDSAGNPIAFTDGAPFGRVAYSWVSLAKAQEWGILT